jgi:hypothetical protein
MTAYKMIITLMLIFISAVSHAKNADATCPMLHSIGIKQLPEKEDGHSNPLMHLTTIPDCPNTQKNESCYAVSIGSFPLLCSFSHSSCGNYLPTWGFLIETSAVTPEAALWKVNHSRIFYTSTFGNPYTKQGCEGTASDVRVRIWNLKKNNDLMEDAENEAFDPTPKSDWPKVKLGIKALILGHD